MFPILRSAAVLAAAFFFLPLGCAPSASTPVDRDALIQESSDLLKAGKYDELVEMLRPHVSAREIDPQLSTLYGRALVLNKQATLAIFPLERVTSLPDAKPAARAIFIQALLAGGAGLETIREATEFLEEFPDHVNVRRLRADAYRGTLRMDEAIEDLSYLSDNDPDDARALEAKLDLLVEQDRADEARDTLDDLAELMEQDSVLPSVKATFCAARARFENDQGDAPKALKMLDECVEQFPKDPTVLLSRVDVLEEAEGVDAATEFLREVAAKTPGRFRVQYALASRLLRLGETEEAEQIMIAASKTVGGAQPSLALADFRVSQRDFTGAREAVLEGIRLQLGKGPGDPDFSWTDLPVEAQFAFGDLFITAEDFEHAEEIIKIVELDAYRLILEARLTLAKGDPAKALETYEEAFRLWPSNPGARYLAGVAAMQVGEFDQAASYYQDALRSDAAANDAGLVLANMQLAQGYPGAAVDTLGTYSRENEADPHALRLFGKAAVMAGLFQFGEGARARLASDVDWAGIALADQALDLARLRGQETAISYIESSEELFEATHFEALVVWADLLGQVSETEGKRGLAKIKSLYDSKPNAPGYVIAWARVLARDGKWEEVRTLLTPVVEAYPVLRAAQTDLGTALLNLGEIDAALERFDRADQIDPLDPGAAFAACRGLIEKGESVRAAERLEDLLERHPWHGAAALRLAKLRMANEDFGERTGILARQAARFIGVSGPESFLTLGRFELETGNPKEAADWLGRGLSKGVGTPSDRFVFATALIESDRRDAAAQELNRLLSGPEFPEADEARAALEALGAAASTNSSEKTAG